MGKLKVSFNSVQKNIDIFLEKEGIFLDSKFRKKLLAFLSKICDYQEEEIRIRPNIIICKDIKSVLEGVANSERIKLNTGKVDGSDMNKILKSTVPFCKNGWIVYIDFEDVKKTNGLVEYGIIRSFTGITGIPLIENVTEISPEDIHLIKYKFVEISVLSNYEVQLKGLKSQPLIIDFRIHDESDLFPNDVIHHLIEDIISDYKLGEIIESTTRIKTTKDLRRDLFNSYSNFLNLLPQKVYGTILLVVKTGYTPNDLLKDGVWLEKPINISELALNAGTFFKDTLTNEMFYAYSSLLIEMLNIDGITVIDSKGQILGYNVFVNNPLTIENKEVSGGARKRAAQMLISSSDESFVGVYFQSQDGNAFYERMVRK